MSETATNALTALRVEWSDDGRPVVMTREGESLYHPEPSAVVARDLGSDLVQVSFTVILERGQIEEGVPVEPADAHV